MREAGCWLWDSPAYRLLKVDVSGQQVIPDPCAPSYSQST